MMNTQGLQLSLVTIISAVFLLLLLMDKDELEQFALNNSLKLSTIITVLTIIGYSMYKLSSGSDIININILFYAIEEMSILTLVFYYINLKGISFEFKIANERLGNILMYSSIIISALSTISIIFEFKFFKNHIGFIRYDELILFANVILVSIMIPLLPKRKIVNHKEFKKVKKEMDKSFNIMWIIYSIIMVLVITYFIYQKSSKII